MKPLYILTVFLILSSCVPDNQNNHDKVTGLPAMDTQEVQGASQTLEGFDVQSAQVLAGTTGGTSGAFMTIVNKTGQKDCLASVSSEVADMVQIHETVMDKDVMTMHQVPCIPLGQGGSAELKRGGYHIMLMGLKKDLKAGDSVELTLNFENAGPRKLMVPVVTR